MKKNYCLIMLSLLCSLFIYLFYRTEKTVINQVFGSLVSFDKYIDLRKVIVCTLPLNKHIIYSLPEGLWVLCITLTSKSLYVKMGSREISLLFIPLLFSTGLELLQLLHLTNGRFDFWDIGMSILFWAIANYLIKHTGTRQNMLHPFNARSFICLLSYLVVYSARVWT